MTKGYAVIVDGEIDIRTVSPTVRAAKVNWLSGKCMIFSDDDDEKIKGLFETYSGECVVEEVIVKRIGLERSC